MSFGLEDIYLKDFLTGGNLHCLVNSSGLGERWEVKVRQMESADPGPPSLHLRAVCRKHLWFG